MRTIREILRLKLDKTDVSLRQPHRELDQSAIMKLTYCERYQNVIISGPTGVEKSDLSCDLTNKACREGYRALHIRAPARPWGKPAAISAG